MDLNALSFGSHRQAGRLTGGLICLLLCTAAAAGGADTVSPPAANDRITLSGRFPGETWQFFSGKKDARLEETWKIINDADSGQPVLICTGEPHGYIQTARSFAAFEMELEWRYPRDANGNSGILLFVNGEPRLWPASVQVQLYQPEAGSTFPNGSAKTGNELRKVPPLSKPVNNWNRCHIVCRAGTVTVTINGQKVGEVTGCDPQSGAIGLQSEGSEIHFRNVVIRPLPMDLASQGGVTTLKSLPQASNDAVLATEPLQLVPPVDVVP
ncbi:3-keto-disaccharide hydrolase [Planctomicrobium piriforme]|uniref:3-keto-alpha-glucoside-1,2-lyase/3-keto-2-hydroxy-glucal hydratase domain-containing protein n=1 Tax=Planctomicrobium piriforme TaxID=1576369 RepID=A0A1I3DAV9_9PLAN|nr:DUF1080 domain-containing protein [Planctomicrobium piriforme]SFH83776.1 protein of unknown function [Planctomicrobium piriforme]